MVQDGERLQCTVVCLGLLEELKKRKMNLPVTTCPPAAEHDCAAYDRKMESSFSV